MINMLNWKEDSGRFMQILLSSL